MADSGRKGLENGLEVLYWGLEGRLRRFLDVYVLDKRKDFPKGKAPVKGLDFSRRCYSLTGVNRAMSWLYWVLILFALYGLTHSKVWESCTFTVDAFLLKREKNSCLVMAGAPWVSVRDGPL